MPSWKILVVGGGGREHALVWKLKQSKAVSRVYCAPGNGGLAQAAKCVNIKPENIRGLADFAQKNKIDLTVVGPEGPLAAGIVDEFYRRKLRIFGPDRQAAQLESSKLYAKEFMRKYHIPTAPWQMFDSAAEAIGFLKSAAFPVVIKADGLAAGKGVSIAQNFDDGVAAVQQMLEKRVFGRAGNRVIIEACLTGVEVSIHAITDGTTVIPLLPSQDHKRALDNDEGPNTGGMGAYCPATFVTDDMAARIHEHILQPTVAGIQAEGLNYRGVLYVGLMLTETGPKVLEYNCRFGDPETQAILPLLRSDLASLCKATVERRLSRSGKIEWHPGSAAVVVMAAPGYPGSYPKDLKIGGLNHAAGTKGTYVFHAGTRRDGRQYYTTGGRVLGVMGRGDSLSDALGNAYGLVKRISFDGVQYRTDIGLHANRSITLTDEPHLFDELGLVPEEVTASGSSDEQQESETTAVAEEHPRE